jgi:hypothetical protein
MQSDQLTLDLAAYLDISLLPIRKERQSLDWQRSRYLWARIGYDRIFNSVDHQGREVVENRGIVSILGKALLPAGVVAEGRARADLRWTGGDYSTRYRARIEFTREFTIAGHSVVPFLNAEWMYDTRYSDWARTLYMFGPEIAVNKGFRYQVYVARQVDTLPKKTDLNALGVNVMWYF